MVNASLQIITKNKQEYLYYLLKSLRYQKVSNMFTYEIVIVDDGNGSSKGIVDNFSELPIKYLVSDFSGISKARNLGIQACEGEIIIFTDDDVILENNFLENHIKMHLIDENVIAIGKKFNVYLSDYTRKSKKPELDAACKGNIGLIQKFIKEDFYSKISMQTLGDNLYSGIEWISFVARNVSLRKIHLVETGLFDENMSGWGADDIDLGYRLYQLNKLLFLKCNKASVFHLEHRVRENSHESLKRNLNYLKSKYSGLAFELYTKFSFGEISLEEFAAGYSFKEMSEFFPNKTYYKMWR